MRECPVGHRSRPFVENGGRRSSFFGTTHSSHVTHHVVDPGWGQTDMGGASVWLPTRVRQRHADVLAALTIDDTGRFLAYDGRERTGESSP